MHQPDRMRKNQVQLKLQFYLIFSRLTLNKGGQTTPFNPRRVLFSTLLNHNKLFDFDYVVFDLVINLEGFDSNDFANITC